MLPVSGDLLRYLVRDSAAPAIALPCVRRDGGVRRRVMSRDNVVRGQHPRRWLYLLLSHFGVLLLKYPIFQNSLLFRR